MSEEYPHVGTVRRRPRTAHQRPHSSTENNGKAKSNGAHKLNGHSHTEFERDSHFDRAAGAESDPEPEVQPRRRPRPRADERPRAALPYPGRELDEEPPLFKFPFDPWRLFGAAKRNFPWILAGSVLLGLIGFYLAAFTIQNKISLQLIRKTSNAVHTDGAIPDQFAPREFSDATLYGFLKSGDVLRGTAARAATNVLLSPLKVTAADLSKAVSVAPSPNPDFVILTMKTLWPARVMPELINLYAEEAVRVTRDYQRKESRVINEYLRSELDKADAKIAQLNERSKSFDNSGVLGFERATDQGIQELISKKTELEKAQQRYGFLGKLLGSFGSAAPTSRLQQARQELANLRLTRTDMHPDVKAKLREIELLEKRKDGDEPAAAAIGSNATALETAKLEAERTSLEGEIAQLGNSITNIQKRLESRNVSGYDIIKSELDSAKKARDVLAEKERQSRLFADNALGYFGVMDPATSGSINTKSRWLKVAVLTLVAAFVGFLASLGIVLVSEVLDTSLRTAEDITRVTRLPVLATLGDLKKMSAAAQVQWAFKTLTHLKGKLSRNPDQSLVCGIISANHGEGRSTWVNLLVSAASQRGLRVLTVDTRPTAAAPVTAAPTPAPEPEPAPEKKSGTATQGAEAAEAFNLPDQPTTTLETNVLSTPAKVAEQFDDPNSQPVVHIPLPGWVWSLERRKQWQKALEYWRNIDNLVIFVELPPASESEAVLLAEHLPQLIWLVGSGMADAGETAEHIETLRNARCKLVGAVLNQAPPPFVNAKISRWFNRVASMVLLSLGLGFGANAAESELAPATEPKLQVAVLQKRDPSEEKPLGFSAAAKHKRAQWQQRLTFGPGDVVDIHFFSNSVYTALSRTNVFIGPDGRINYLYANGIPAAGLTVEELRQKIADALTPFYKQSPTIVVVPVSFSSKKYYMLGKVNAKGAYVLDRPLTLVEAVARAKGLETGLYQRTTVEMADLGHSFLIRNGQKMPINFEKLFLEGDLTQNEVIEPNDYIYFASTAANDIYVLGEVMSPGPIGFVPNATVLSAITDRGGFSDRAYKRRVLVIRGSLNEPETFVVDSGGMLDARFRDFRLQPKDIVYVGHRPWAKAEEMLDEAAGAFIEGAMTTYAGIYAGPFITRRLLPGVRIK